MAGWSRRWGPISRRPTRITPNTRCRRAACCSPTITTPAARSSSTCAIRSHPKIAASFNDMAGYMHPHSYLRLPNGHVLATFQHAHHCHGRQRAGRDRRPGGDRRQRRGRPLGQQRGPGVSRRAADAVQPGRPARARSRGVYQLVDAPRDTLPRRDLPGVAALRPEAARDGVLRRREEPLRPHQPGRAPARSGRLDLRAVARLRHRAHHRRANGRAPLAARAHVPRQLVRRPDDRRTLPRPERAGSYTA